MNNTNTPTPLSCGCPCPPQPTQIYTSFEEAVLAADLMFIRPGHTITVYYQIGNEIHCIVAIGNIKPAEKNLIITDSGRSKSITDQIAEITSQLSGFVTEEVFNETITNIQAHLTLIDSSLAEIQKTITDTSIQELFGTYKYSTLIFGSNGGQVRKANSSVLYREGDVIEFGAYPYGNHQFLGWYDNGNKVSIDTSYFKTVTGNVLVKPVLKVSEVTLGYLNPVFASVHNFNATVDFEATLPTELDDLIQVTGTRDTSFVSTTFETGNTIKIQTTPCVAHKFDYYLIYSAEPDQILNWENLGERIDFNTRKVTEAIVNIKDIFADVSVTTKLSEIIWQVSAGTKQDNICSVDVQGESRIGFETLNGSEVAFITKLNKGIDPTMYQFQGWYDNLDCTGEAISNKEIYIINVTSDIKLYAKWEERVFTAE